MITNVCVLNFYLLIFIDNTCTHEFRDALIIDFVMAVSVLAQIYKIKHMGKYI